MPADRCFAFCTPVNGTGTNALDELSVLSYPSHRGKANNVPPETGTGTDPSSTQNSVIRRRQFGSPARETGSSHFRAFGEMKHRRRPTGRPQSFARQKLSYLDTMMGGMSPTPAMPHRDESDRFGSAPSTSTEFGHSSGVRS